MTDNAYTRRYLTPQEEPEPVDNSGDDVDKEEDGETTDTDQN